MSDRPTGRPPGVPPGALLERDRSGPSLPAPDPRLRARRIEVRRTEGRRRLRRLLIALGVTVICLGAWGLTRSPLLDVDHVEVSGLSQLTVDEVVAAAGITTGDALLDVDLGGATDAVAELPWVESVEVHRRWGGTVEINVTERTPVTVVVGPESSAWLVDAGGWVIAPTAPTDRPELTRVEATAPVEPGTALTDAELLGVQVAGSLTVGLVAEVAAVEVASDGDVWLRLMPDAGGVDPAALPEVAPGRVQLGDARELADQLVAAETVLSRVDLTCVAVVDVRVASSPVVSRHPECGA